MEDAAFAGGSGIPTRREDLPQIRPAALEMEPGRLGMPFVLGLDKAFPLYFNLWEDRGYIFHALAFYYAALRIHSITVMVYHRLLLRDGAEYTIQLLGPLSHMGAGCHLRVDIAIRLYARHHIRLGLPKGYEGEHLRLPSRGHISAYIQHHAGARRLESPMAAYDEAARLDQDAAL